MTASVLWRLATEAMQADVPPSAWSSCFQPTMGLRLEDDVLVLGAPSVLVKERLDGRWSPAVSAALTALGQPHLKVQIEVQPGRRTDDAATPATSELLSREKQPRPTAAPLAGLNPRYTFDNFVTGASNRYAHAAALAVAETPSRSYNPLFIYGGAGLGKTHLLHAIAQHIHHNIPDQRMRYVSCEVFMNDFVDAIRANTTTSFKRRYRENDVLLIDDVQFMEGKEGLQEEFFHTFNQLHGANRQIIITSDRPPRSIATLEDRLRSRFEWGLMVDIAPPDLETRLAILRKKAEREAFFIPEDVLVFIVTHITNNIRELEGALTRVSAYATKLDQRPLTTQLVADVLGDVASTNRTITVKAIIEATGQELGFSVEELTGRSRRRPLVIARQIAMYLCKELTGLTFPSIAREFGGRDHTTVIHAVDKIAALMEDRPEIYNQVTELIHSIRSPSGSEDEGTRGRSDGPAPQSYSPSDATTTSDRLGYYEPHIGLARTLLLRFREGGDTSDLDRVINITDALLTKLGSGTVSQEAAIITQILADALQKRYELSRNPADVERAVKLYEHALTIVNCR